jgi:hypothetical protein
MWKLTLHGNSDHPQDEHGFVEFFRELFGKVNANGRPSGDPNGSGDNLVHAEFVGSHTGTHNLLSNPEPEPEPDTTVTPTTPEPKGNPLTLDSVLSQDTTTAVVPAEEETNVSLEGSSSLSAPTGNVGGY